MGGKSSKPPAQPNPYDVANAQAQANIQTALAQQNIGAVNQYGPYGSLTYARDPTTGQMYQTTSLTPEGTFATQAQQGAGAYLAGLGYGQAANLGGMYGQPLNLSGLPGPQYSPSTSAINAGMGGKNQGFSFNTASLPDLGQDYGQQFENVSQSVLQAQLPVLNQLQSQQQQSLEAKLAGQGITQGSEAYNREQQRLAGLQSQAYNELAAQAYGQGLQTQGQLFNQLLGSRGQLFGEQATQASQAAQNRALTVQARQAAAQQALAEAQFANATRQQEIQNMLLQRQYPLQEMNQLFGMYGGGQPQFGGISSPNLAAPNLQQGVQNYYTGAQNIYNQQMAQQNANTSALAGLGSAAIYAFSDRRLKTDVVRVGTHEKGFGIYEYNIFGSRQRGVMADEVEKVIPDAVMTTPIGLKMVDYSKL